MTINEICEDVELLNILTIFKSIIKLGTIIVPVILVIFIIIDVVKTISSADVDSKKLSKSITKRLTAAVIVFLIPMILNLVLGLIPVETSYYLACYENANKDKVNSIATDNVNKIMTELNLAFTNSDYDSAYILYEQARINIKKIPDKNIRSNYNETLTSYKKWLQELKDGKKVNISNNEGSIQTTTSNSKYTYKDVEKILKKYDISEERKQIVLNAASYVGKIPYYWGGTAKSKDYSSNNFNITIASDMFGNSKKGLDCSHFVDFVFWQITNDNLGNGNTVHIWDNRSYKINKDQLLPGDVGFEINYDIDRNSGNHIGIFVGLDDKGKQVWVHEAGKPYNNVVINNRSLPNYRRIDIIK